MQGKTEKRLTRRTVKAFRKTQGWSAQDLGRELGNGIAGAEYSRSYVKSIEGGSLPISRFFQERFEVLRARIVGEQVRSKNILMRGAMPKRLVIAGKLKKCPVCHWAFVGASSNQKYCGQECADKARRLSASARTPTAKRKAVKTKSRKTVKT